LTGSSAFLHFTASDAQDIGIEYTEMQHKIKKALDLQVLSDKYLTIKRKQ